MIEVHRHTVLNLKLRSYAILGQIFILNAIYYVSKEMQDAIFDAEKKSILSMKACFFHRTLLIKKIITGLKTTYRSSSQISCENIFK